MFAVIKKSTIFEVSKEIKLTLTIMKNLLFKVEEDEFQTVILTKNSEEVGRIEVSDHNDGLVAHIEFIEIKKEYRGKGFYKMLLMSVFTLLDYGRILSDCRNEYSQPIYEHWTNNSELEDDTIVEIVMENETIYFELD